MTTLRTISAFKSKLAGGGARPNLFEVEIPAFPEAISAEVWKNSEGPDLFKFMCKSAQLPASNIAEIPIPFRGRVLKVAGDRTFDPWSVTIINDENFLLRNAFEAWMQLISSNGTNTGATQPTSYMKDAHVHQLGRGAENGPSSTVSSNSVNGSEIKPLKSYTFYDIFPTSISAIDLSYDSSDTIEEFTVDFQVQYGEPGIYGKDG